MHTTQGKPQTIEAILPSNGRKNTAGIGKRPNNWTLHVYEKSEVALYQRTTGQLMDRMIVHVYRCTETGALRVWGSEAVPMGWTGGGN